MLKESLQVSRDSEWVVLTIWRNMFRTIERIWVLINVYQREILIGWLCSLCLCNGCHLIETISNVFVLQVLQSRVGHHHAVSFLETWKSTFKTSSNFAHQRVVCRSFSLPFLNTAGLFFSKCFLLHPTGTLDHKLVPLFMQRYKLSCSMIGISMIILEHFSCNNNFPFFILSAFYMKGS